MKETGVSESIVYKERNQNKYRKQYLDNSDIEIKRDKILNSIFSVIVYEKIIIQKNRCFYTAVLQLNDVYSNIIHLKKGL